MAIIERRDIEFDRQGLLEAVARGTDGAARLQLPPGTATDIIFRAEQGAIEIVFGVTRASQRVSLQGEALAALLLHFCIEARVPLPRGADKTVKVGTEVAILRFTSVLRTPPLPAVPPSKFPRSMSWRTPGAASSGLPGRVRPQR